MILRDLLKLNRPILNMCCAIVMATFVGFGCSDPVSSNSGVLRVRITDAPFPYGSVRSVLITIDRIEVRPSLSTGYQIVNSVDQSFDLISLQGGRTDTLGTMDVAAGEFEAVRLQVKSVSVELRDGRTFLPEVSDSIRVHGVIALLNSPAEVKDNQITELVVDFDLPRSLRVQGDPSTLSGITGFEFTPAVRGVNLATTGQITGTIKHDNSTPSNVADDVVMRNLAVSLVQIGTRDTVSVVTNTSGEYIAYFLPAGSYSITTASTDSTGAWSLPGVIVTTANPTRQDALTDRQ
jgi:hypothetical protein